MPTLPFIAQRVQRRQANRRFGLGTPPWIPTIQSNENLVTKWEPEDIVRNREIFALRGRQVLRTSVATG